MGPQFTFQLREGRYLVVATAGDLVGELPFDVKALEAPYTPRGTVGFY